MHILYVRTYIPGSKVLGNAETFKLKFYVESLEALYSIFTFKIALRIGY